MNVERQGKKNRNLFLKNQKSKNCLVDMNAQVEQLMVKVRCFYYIIIIFFCYFETLDVLRGISLFNFWFRIF